MAMDLFKGWPYDGAINDNAPVKDGVTVVEGMAIKKDANGELILATGAANEVAFFALKSSEDLDVAFAKSLPYLVSNYIVLTDQFVADTYAIGDRLEVDSGNPGKLKKHAGGGAPVFGNYDGTITRDGLDMMKVISGK